MKVIEAVRKGFGLAGRNFGLIAVIFLFNLAVGLISAAMIGFGAIVTPTSIPPEKAIGFLILIAVSAILGVFLNGGILGVLGEGVKSEKPQIGRMLSFCAKFFGKLLGLGLIITGILLIGAVLVSILIGLVIALKANIFAMTILAALAALIILAGIYFMILVIFAPYSVVINNEGVVGAMKKSIGVTKKLKGKIIGLFAAIALVSIAIIAIVSGILWLIENVIKLSPAIMDVVRIVVNSGVNAYINIAMVSALLLYYLAKTAVAPAQEQPPQA